ncbi:MAG: hypothetical protein ACE5IQ_11605 [Candidatus Methylomirabilales bacterium]
MDVLGRMVKHSPLFFGLAALTMGILGTGCGSPKQLAIANGNLLKIVEPESGQTLHEITRYQEVMRLAYRPDGERLAVGICFGDRVVELESGTYGEIGVAVHAAACPWDLGYAPDNQSLAAAIPWRPDPLAALFGHLWIGGPQPLDRDMGRPSPALAYRPGGSEIAVSTPQGLTILGIGPGYPVLVTLAGVHPLSLGYTIDGGRLIAGTASGFVVLDAGAGYAVGLQEIGGVVRHVAIDPSGGWIALVRENTVSVRRSPDLAEVTSLSSSGGFSGADFSPDGAMLAVAERSGPVRLFRTVTWQELSPIPVTGRVDAVRYRPQGFGQRMPVLFVHGHSGGSAEAWFETAGGTSFAAALGANPQLPIDAFYLELPVHGGTDPAIQGRSIAEDAQDILAIVEGGLDSGGAQQVGILNMPAYQGIGRLAIIAYSQGTMSSRYYLKHFMGSRQNGAVTIFEFVALAAPTHGVGGVFSCGNANEPDRARRQLCGGSRATLTSQLSPCGTCPPGVPGPFSTNQPGDDTFITDLNTHPFSDDCASGYTNPAEAPFSRPSQADGVLYVNLFAAGNDDAIVGGATQTGDCLGRRLAVNHAPDAVNMEIAGVPGVLAQVHANFPHHWPTICAALRTVVDHQAPPDPTQACGGLTPP